MESQVEITIYLAMGAVIFTLLAGFVISAVYMNVRQRVRHIQEKTKLQYSFEQERLLAQIEIKEKIMYDISQELHDNVGQVLSLAKLYLGNHGTPEKQRERIEESRKLIGKVIEEIRDISHSLNSEHISNHPLPDSLKAELELLQRSEAISVHMTTTGTPREIKPDNRILVFRIVQELIQNIIKHAQASHVNLILNFNEELYRLVLEDDGIGFDLNDKSIEGTGLGNVTQRCHLLNAQLNISGNLHGGTVVTIDIPYTRK